MKRILNGEMIADASAQMRELPQGVAGAFETVLLRDRVMMYWHEHWERFVRGCQNDGFAAPVEADAVCGGVAELAAAEGVVNGVARWAAWRVAHHRIEWSIEVAPPRPHMHKSPFRVTWGGHLPDPTPDRAFKHLRRTAWLDTLHAARAGGYDEALLTDLRGNLVEACVTNVFFVCEGRLCTPRLSAGPLPGVMREQVLACARAEGWTVDEGDFHRTSVAATATEMWLTSSLIGIRPVAALDERKLPASTPVLDRFREIWSRRHGWDPVIIS